MYLAMRLLYILKNIQKTQKEFLANVFLQQKRVTQHASLVSQCCVRAHSKDLPFQENLPTVQVDLQKTLNSILSSEIRLVVVQNKDATANAKLYFHCVERYSTLNVRVLIKFSPTTNSNLSLSQWEPTLVKCLILQNFVITKSSS